jgi:hypothetical protein
MLCSAKTRDAESGEWLAALTFQPLCSTDRGVMISCLTELPHCYSRLARLALEPVRRSRPVRVPPGSRVLASPEGDALMRIIATTVGGWAARVRTIPQLSLARHGHPHGSQGQVTADCATLAAHPDPLLALAAADMTRTWTWHPGAVQPPPDTEAVIGALDAVRGGDGWVTAFTALSGEDAGLEVIDLRYRAVRLLGETPAPPELLDGIPCRSCEAMSSLEVVPTPPPDPEKPPPVFCRCGECRDEMARKEYDDWVRQYHAWVKGSGILTCRRCDLGHCKTRPSDCQWSACTCKASGHRKAA